VDGPGLLAYPTNINAYSQLSSLLSVGNLRTEKGKCELYKADVYQYSKDMKFIIIPPGVLNEQFQFEPSFKKTLEEYRDTLGKDIYLAGCRYYNGDDGKQLHQLSQLSAFFNIPLVATNDVHYS
jgi:error-prone DNA polymerase